MAFPRRLLSDGEVIVLEVRPHWTFFMGPGLALIASGALTAAVFVEAPTAPVIVADVLGALMALSAVWFGARWLRWVTRSLVVSTQRVLLSSGFAGRKVDDVQLAQLNRAGMRQGVLGWIVRSGTLTLDTGGPDGVLRWHNTPHPADVQRVVNHQIDQARLGLGPSHDPRDGLGGDARARVPATGASTGPTSDVIDQIERLDDLCRRGVISPADFAAKKAQLLDRL